MISIKLYKRKKKNNSSSGSSGSSGSGSSSNTNFNPANDWFFFDSDNNAVGCKYDFYSVGNVAANGAAAAAAAGFTTAQIEALAALIDKMTIENGEITIDATIAQQHNP